MKMDVSTKYNTNMNQHKPVQHAHLHVILQIASVDQLTLSVLCSHFMLLLYCG